MFMMNLRIFIILVTVSLAVSLVETGMPDKYYIWVRNFGLVFKFHAPKFAYDIIVDKMEIMQDIEPDIRDMVHKTDFPLEQCAKLSQMLTWSREYLPYTGFLRKKKSVVNNLLDMRDSNGMGCFSDQMIKIRKIRNYFDSTNNIYIYLDRIQLSLEENCLVRFTESIEIISEIIGDNKIKHVKKIMSHVDEDTLMKYKLDSENDTYIMDTIASQLANYMASLDNEKLSATLNSATIPDSFWNFIQAFQEEIQEDCQSICNLYRILIMNYLQAQRFIREKFPGRKSKLDNLINEIVLITKFCCAVENKPTHLSIDDMSYSYFITRKRQEI